MLRCIRSFRGGRFPTGPISTARRQHHPKSSPAPLPTITTAAAATPRKSPSCPPRAFSSSASRLGKTLKWTPELDAQLLKLRQEGNGWREVGSLLDRSLSSCYNRYHNHLNFHSTAFWTPKRNRRLRILALRPIPWDVVAREVQQQEGQEQGEVVESHGVDLSSTVCQQHWRVLMNRTSGRGEFGKFFRKQDTTALYERLEIEKQRLRRKQSHVTTDADLDMTQLDWEAIVKELFQDRLTAEQAQYHYSTTIRQSHKWTDSQVELLPQFVALHTSEKDGLTSKSWERIASEYDNQHTADQCKVRWEALSLANIRKKIISRRGNRWSEDEIRAYWKAWKQHGNNWDLIAQAVRSVHAEDGSTMTSDMSPPSDSARPFINKSAKDCEADFKHVVTVSLPMIKQLEKEIGDLALSFSLQPRKRWAWTVPQLIAMEGAVRDLMGDFRTIGEVTQNMALRDWKKVARKVDPKVTGDQCRYRWRRIDLSLPSLLTPDRLSPVPYSDNDTNTFNNKGHQWRRSRVWAPEEMKALEEAVESVRSLQQLPKHFGRRVREEYNLDRTNAEIRTMANEILGRSRVPGTVVGDFSPARAASSLLKVVSATGTTLRQPPTLTEKRLHPESFLTFLDDKDNDEKKDKDEEEEEEEDDDEDADYGQMHPSMFVAPGILITERLKPRSTTIDAALPSLSATATTTTTTAPIPRFVWRMEDAVKLRKLVQNVV
ncbi:hypothetical protein BGX23_012269 [Mortierella sp. AD031]|nr:hypothetical protein BGX23_012269 [Mortierella sp. AD031]